jgi:hypothetical protein
VLEESGSFRGFDHARAEEIPAPAQQIAGQMEDLDDEREGIALRQDKLPSGSGVGRRLDLSGGRSSPAILDRIGHCGSSSS